MVGEPRDAADPSSGPPPFAALVLSISTAALERLGEGPASEASPAEPDLAAARQLIDWLEVLEAKTRGNLEPEERQLLEGVLVDLRLRFVRVAARVRGEGGGGGEASRR